MTLARRLQNPTSLKQRVAIIATGNVAKEIEELLFDWILYGAVVAWTNLVWGPVWGSIMAFVVMAPASAFVCQLYLIAYDWAKIDWLGLETLKENREHDVKRPKSTGFVGFLAWSFYWLQLALQWVQRQIIGWGYWPALIFLSVNKDPFYTTAYFRKGAHRYDGLDRDDWRTFWVSVLVSNGYWTLRWVAIIEIVQWIFGKVPHEWKTALARMWILVVNSWEEISQLIANLF